MPVLVTCGTLIVLVAMILGGVWLIERSDEGPRIRRGELKSLRKQNRVMRRTLDDIRFKTLELDDIDRPLATLILARIRDCDDQLQKEIQL